MSFYEEVEYKGLPTHTFHVGRSVKVIIAYLKLPVHCSSMIGPVHHVIRAAEPITKLVFSGIFKEEEKALGPPLGEFLNLLQDRQREIRGHFLHVKIHC